MLTYDWRAFELWAQYLRRTDPSEWTDEVQADWLPVVGDEWQAWLRANRFKLFVHLGKAIKRAPVRAMSLVKPSDMPLDAERYATYVFDLEAPISVLLEGVEGRLRIAIEARSAGRPAWETNTGKWKLARRPDIDSLTITLAAYDLRREHPATDKDWPLWRIGQQLQKLYPILQDQKIKDGEPSVEQRKVVTSTVSRYLKRADALLAGVRKGEFPAA